MAKAVAKVEKLRVVKQAPISAFIRPEPRPILEIGPEDVGELIKSDVLDAYWVMITDEVAQAFLEHMGPNRKLKGSNCDRITRDMISDHFYETNNGIGCNVRGEVFDANNRLTAIVRSGKPQKMLVVVGLPVEAQAVVDRNASRSFADDLRIAGHHHYFLLAGATQWLYNIKLSRPNPNKKPGEQTMRMEAASLPELHALRERHHLLAESCVFEEKIRLDLTKRREKLEKLVPPTLITAVHYVGKYLQNEPDMADMFVDRIVKWPMGSQDRNDPAHQFSKYLYSRREKTLRVRSGRNNRLASIIRAWNLFREEKSIDKWTEVKYQSLSGFNYDVL